MPSLFSRRLGRMLLTGAGVVVVVTGVAAAAVGLPSQPAPSASAPATAPQTAIPSPSGTAPLPPSGTATAAGVTKVKTRTGPLGTYLTDADGRSLYLFEADTPNSSHCTGDCANVWAPLLTAFNGKSGSGVDGAKLGTTLRPDGTKQITYNGHPLYLYGPDKHAGDTLGQGLDNFGATWWLINPAGDPIT